MTVQAQALTDRRSFLGGSDAGAVLGFNPHRSPFQVWEEKTGKVEPGSQETIETSLGKYLEEWVAQRYALQTGREVKVPDRAYVHPKFTWMRGNIDRIAEGPLDHPTRLLECKTGSREEGWGDRPDEIPMHYLAQCLHYLAVTGAQAIDVAALIYNGWKKEVRFYSINRVEDAIAYLTTREEAFWKVNVQRNVAPDPVNLQEAKRAFKLIDGKSVQTTEEIMAKVGQLRATRATMNELKKSKLGLERDIAVYMRDATVLSDEFGEEVARIREVGRKGYVVQPTTYRQIVIAGQGSDDQ